MLISFSATNFKSFKNEISFSLKKDENINILEQNTTDGLLKSLLFVGPNASGKSNSISILELLLELVFGENLEDISMYVNIFNNDDMKINYKFQIENKIIVYNLKYVFNQKIIEEEIIVDNVSIAKRNGLSYESAKIKLPENLVFKKDEPILKYIIASGFNMNLKVAVSIYNYLENSVILDLYNNRFDRTSNRRFNPTVTYDDELLEVVNNFLITHSFDYVLYKNNKKCPIKDIFFIKKNSKIKMPFFMESVGNQTLVYLLPIIIEVINTNGMLILDEFGSGMHNELEELLLSYFMKNATNSQIFIVSHSTNLLTNVLLRPDQIYSVDFIEESTIATRFSTENPRNGQNLEKMYLGGVFGGLPNYSKK